MFSDEKFTSFHKYMRYYHICGTTVHQAPSYQPNLTLPAPFPIEFAYLTMLFILGVVQTTSRINSALKLANYQISKLAN